jgi:hypothetical protein
MVEEIKLTFKPNVSGTSVYLFIIKSLESYLRKQRLFSGTVRGSISNEKLNKELEITIGITVK